MHSFNKILSLFNYLQPKRRIQFILLLALSMCSSFAEVFSLGASVPFIAALMGQAPDNFFYKLISENITGGHSYLLIFTVIFCTLSLLAGVIRIFNLYFFVKFSNIIGCDISQNLFNKIIYQDYQTQILRDKSAILSALTQKPAIVTGSILSLLTLLGALIISIGIILGLIYINFRVALFSLFGVLLIYSATALLSRNKLIGEGNRLTKFSTLLIKTTQETFGSMRDILMDGTQKFAEINFNNAVTNVRQAEATTTLIGQYPKLIAETLGILLISSVAYFLTADNSSSDSIIPTLGAMALAAQRLLPLFQQIFSAWANIKYGEPSLNDVLNLLREKDDFQSYAEKSKSMLKFDKEINFNNVSFSYSNGNGNSINNLSLSIKKGEKIGIIGSTGSGKSTLLDLLAGLLLPKQGYLHIDDNVLSVENRHSWKKNIAYVPQSIFLIDGTISENIAMGAFNEPLDIDRLKNAARIAQIDKFIEELQGGYEALIGANGVMLSGGQRQRIGIARAMYKKSTFIIFDEVTSALDRDTELNLLESIGVMDNSITMVMVAHKPAALKFCDRIIKIDDGQIVDVGTYNYFFN